MRITSGLWAIAKEKTGLLNNKAYLFKKFDCFTIWPVL